MSKQEKVGVWWNVGFTVAFAYFVFSGMMIAEALVLGPQKVASLEEKIADLEDKAEYKAVNPRFHFGETVKIVGGFYKGRIGEIHGVDFDDDSATNKYQVLIAKELLPSGITHHWVNGTRVREEHLESLENDKTTERIEREEADSAP